MKIKKLSISALDLTTGSPRDVLIRFAIPMFIGTLFQQAYNIVDTLVVGNFLGEQALAGVGTSGVIMSMTTGIGMGLAIGCNIIVGQYMGAKQVRDARSAINTGLIAFGGLGLLCTVVGLCILNPMLRLLNVPDDTVAYSREYLTVIFLGIVFVMVYNVLNQISNALGDSKTPMLMLMLASVINLVLDLLFTVAFGWGVAGVALATIIGQGVSAVTCYFNIQRRLRDMATDEPVERFSVPLFRKMLSLGLPAMLQNVISSSGTLAFQRLMNSFGSTVMAAFAASNKIDGIAMAPMVALGTAMSSFTAQNMGAGKKERVKQGLRSALAIALLVCSVMCAVIFFGGRSILTLFVESGSNTELLDVGSHYLRIICFTYWIMAFMFIFTGLLRGSGDVKIVFACALLDLGGRAFFAYATVGFLGVNALWLSYPFGWICSLALCVPRYLSHKWEKLRVIETDADKTVEKPA